ncbi:MAG: CAAX prenyl protease-related protein [bacterium]
MIPRILPFLLFMGFIGIEQGLRFLSEKGVVPLSDSELLYLYPIKAVSVAVLLLVLWPRYDEVRFRDLWKWKDAGLSVAVGVVVFVLWINLDRPWAVLGEPAGFDPTLISNGSVQAVLVGFRLFGAVLVVPVMEELFWRSYLLRYVIAHDFHNVPIGRFTWPSLIVVSILFALAHHLVVAGFITGILYAVLLYRTKSIAQCILAHGLTNLLLGIYVLQTGSWQLW